MRQWLVCGPFPIQAPAGTSVDEAIRKEAFARDFLEEHGSETQIEPAPDLTHRIEETDFTWRPFTAEQDVVDLDAVFGRHENVIVYAAAVIETSAVAT